MVRTELCFRSFNWDKIVPRHINVYVMDSFSTISPRYPLLGKPLFLLLWKPPDPCGAHSLHRVEPDSPSSRCVLAGAGRAGFQPQLGLQPTALCSVQTALQQRWPLPTWLWKSPPHIAMSNSLFLPPPSHHFSSGFTVTDLEIVGQSEVIFI